MAGDDTVLPCQLVPVMNAFVMTVEWARRDLDPRFVLLWRDGEELASKKHPSYRGRTSLSTDRLQHGDVSLELSSVRISDEGRYRCFVPDLQKSPTVQLVVGKSAHFASLVRSEKCKRVSVSSVKPRLKPLVLQAPSPHLKS